MTVWRYKYRKPGEAAWQAASCSLASEVTASAVVANWNKRDSGLREWAYEECLPEDEDYPRWAS
jgi:hypothetical protein